MSFESTPAHSDFQYYTDDIFLEIAEYSHVSYKDIDTEGAWHAFLRPVLDEISLLSNKEIKIRDFVFSVDRDRGVLMVSLPSLTDVVKEYKVSESALKKYKDTIEPVLLEQEENEVREKHEKNEQMMRLKQIAQEHSHERFSKETYKDITGNEIAGDFSCRMMENNLEITFYNANGEINDIHTYSPADIV